MALSTYIDQAPIEGPTLVLSGAGIPEPLIAMSNELFDEQPVSVVEEQIESAPENQLLAVQDGEVIAASPFDRFARTILLVNADLYTTGTRSINDLEFPEVLDALEDTEFVLEGYPTSNTQKVLFIAISRIVEQKALDCGDGTLRSGFQRLSRIRDERGTFDVYRRLGDSDVAIHIYGVPDWIPSDDFGALVHGGHTATFRNFWFVVFTPDGTGSCTGMALLSEEIGDNLWRGFWTRDEALVHDIDAEIAATL